MTVRVSLHQLPEAAVHQASVATFDGHTVRADVPFQYVYWCDGSVPLAWWYVGHVVSPTESVMFTADKGEQ
jgi:hypothetical protein